MLLRERHVVAPQPLPSLVLNYEESQVSVPPVILPLWEKMSLEPFSAHRNVKYIALVPDNKLLVTQTASLLRDISCSYQVTTQKFVCCA